MAIVEIVVYQKKINPLVLYTVEATYYNHR